MDIPDPTPATPEPARRSRLALAGVVAAVGLVLDLLTKAWAWHTLRDGQTLTVLDNWFYFEFGFNTGAAFSLFRDGSWSRALFIVVTLAALAYMVRLALTLPTRWGSGFVAIGLVSSGAMGNLHDRIVREMLIGGELRYGVVDFIKIYYWPDKPWPTFNVADIALVVGVGLLLIYISRHGEAIDAANQPDAKNASAGPATP